jgi:hypothetical protein
MREGVTFVGAQGSGVEVDGGDALRGSGVEVNNLRKTATVACSEAGVEAIAWSGAGDEAAVCSRARIEDGRWRRWHDGC